MYILGQDKDLFIDSNNVRVFAIDNTDVAIYADMNKIKVILGRYETIERNKEVLKDLLENVAKDEIFYYEMPEK